MSAPSEPEAGSARPQARYYDGHTARARHVVVSPDAEAMTIRDASGLLAVWPYAELRRVEGAARLTLRRDGGPQLARLVIDEAALAGELSRRFPAPDGARRGEARMAGQIAAWSLAAALSLVLSVVYLLPIVADRLVPLIPLSLERRLGKAADNQVRALLGSQTCAAPAGRAALDDLVERLRLAGAVPVTVEVAVLPSRMANAVTLPGGRVYLLAGLIDRAESADELAGVIAHEIGHAAHRDGLKALIQNGASSFLLGLLFGDVAGAGVVVLAGRTLVSATHSREAERAADAHAAAGLRQLGRPPKALGDFLLRLTGTQRGEALAAFLASHPASEDRLAALASGGGTAAGAPLLDAAAWRAVKQICGPA